MARRNTNGVTANGTAGNTGRNNTSQKTSPQTEPPTEDGAGLNSSRTAVKQVTIPDFTKDDYIETSAPYEFLYGFSDNQFVLSQMLERMKIKAGAVGVKAFARMWKDYCNSLSGVSRSEEIRVTEFEGLPLDRQLVSGKYICNTNGVSILDGFGHEQIICTHQIAPVGRYKNIDTGEELLAVWFRKGLSEEKVRDQIITVSKDRISNSITELAKYGVVVHQRNAKDLAEYILNIEDYNYDALEEKHSVKRLGWVSDNAAALSKVFSPYVDDVFFDGEEDFGSMFSAVTERGDFDTWLEAVRKVRAEKTAARYYIAASFASVILAPCGLLPFLVHTWGGTENGKTVALMLAASIWANPELGEYVTTYNGTRYAQETTAGFLNSLPLCLDELQIQSSQGAKDFDDIIYQLCEGVSKKQGKASGGLRKQQKWRNVILSNGEHTIIKPLSGGGARNRVIEIEAPSLIYSDLVGLCAIIGENYGHAGRAFVEWLVEGDNLERVKELQKQYYQQLRQTNATDKQIGSASAILTADHIATEIMFKDGNALTVDDMESVLLKKTDIDVNQKTLEWIYDFVAANSSKFSADSHTEIWGKVDEDDGMIYFNTIYFERELKNNGFDSRSFLAWANRMGLLDHEADRNTRKVRVPGTKYPPRCVCLRITGDAENGVDTGLELPF